MTDEDENKIEIKNAIIEDTFLGIEYHGILTFSITLNYGGSGQTAGNIALLGKGGSSSFKFIKDLLEVVGVKSWEELRGTKVRVKAAWNKVYEIGNFLEDKWFKFDKGSFR